jgi:hypothetical protein
MQRRSIVGVVLAAVVLLGVVLIGVDARQATPAPGTPVDDVIPGLVHYDVASNAHVSGYVDYPQSPPVGGPHNPVFQQCGFYDQPVGNEHAVHSLEHGAVWITYRPGLAAAQVNRLREVAATSDHILVSPYPDLPSPVVVSAWGYQLRLPSADDPRLEQFISRFVNQGPEPGASCTGGTTETIPWATPAAGSPTVGTPVS